MKSVCNGKKVQAHFIGEQGSMGLRKGAIYTLEIKYLPFWKRFIMQIPQSWKWLVKCNKIDGGVCYYSSFKKITENWR